MQEEFDDAIEVVEELLNEVDGIIEIERRERMQILVYQLYDMIWSIRGGFTSQSDTDDTEEDTESIIDDVEDVVADDPMGY